MSDNKPILVVVALIKNNDGRILLQKRCDKKFPEADGKWAFTGGKVDFGESPERALIRECKEEIGCDISIVRMLPITLTKIWETGDGHTMHFVVLCYEARITNGVPMPGDPKVSEIKWYGPEEIERIELMRGVAELFELMKG